MARADEAVKHLKEGQTLRQISEKMGISLGSVKQYLYGKCGEGEIRRSDILFAIPKETRKLLESCLEKLEKPDKVALYYAVDRKGYSLDQEEIRIYLSLRDSRVSMGDMYEFLSEIEITLHRLIKRILQKEYGGNKLGWWRIGVPESVRKDCVLSKEQDPEPVEDNFCYTTLIHLKLILEKQWGGFENYLPKLVVKQKKDFLSELGRLNHIRNAVMHPVKGLPLTENDFQFVRKFLETICSDNWRNI